MDCENWETVDCETGTGKTMDCENWETVDCETGTGKTGTVKLGNWDWKL